MKKGTEPAFPSTSDNLLLQGMSTRLLLAGMVMQGILAGYYANPRDVITKDKQPFTEENAAIAALMYADELIKQEEESRQ